MALNPVVDISVLIRLRDEEVAQNSPEPIAILQDKVLGEHGLDLPFHNANKLLHRVLHDRPVCGGFTEIPLYTEITIPETKPMYLSTFFEKRFLEKRVVSGVSFFQYVLHEIFGDELEERYGSVLVEREQRLSDAKLSTEPNRVCIPIAMLPPRGSFIDFLADSGYRQAFLVALFGQRNPVVCSSCQKIWESTEIDEPKHKNVLFPFHNCTSLKGVANQACGNCIAHGHTCTWAKFPEFAGIHGVGGQIQQPGDKADISQPAEEARFKKVKLNEQNLSPLDWQCSSVEEEDKNTTVRGAGWYSYDYTIWRNFLRRMGKISFECVIEKSC